MHKWPYKSKLPLALLLLIASMQAIAVNEINPQMTVHHLSNMYQHPWFPDVMGASVVGWVVGLVKGFAGTKEWLNNYWTSPPKMVIFFMDLVVFVVAGAYFGVGIYNPDNFVAAVAAGLSWPIGLGALATKD